MKKEDRKKFEGYYLFNFDEMLNKPLERWESRVLNGRTNPSLIYSLVLDMFRFIGDERSEDEILTECKTVQDWYQKHTWTSKQSQEWRSTHLVPILRKRMKIAKYRAEKEAAWFMLQWSFMINDVH